MRYIIIRKLVYISESNRLNLAGIGDNKNKFSALVNEMFKIVA